MLINKTKTLVSTSGLTYNNLIEDAYRALKDSEEFRDNFNSFTSNSAERMIVELYAYVASQLANRMDQIGNELFVDTASINGLSRLMKLVGAKVDFPAAAELEVEVSTSSETDEITFTKGINVSEAELRYIPGSFKYIQANNGTFWEFIKKEVGEDGEFVYDYTHEYKFKTPTQRYILQQGRTQAKTDYVINSLADSIIRLENTSVIKDSIRIYYKEKVLKEGTTDTYEIKEMKKVDNFFTVDALTAKTGIYTVSNLGNGRPEICIRPYYSEVDNVSDIGKSLLIMYRIGGGSNGNVVAVGNISSEETITLTSNGIETGKGLLHITNTTSGSGGADELTPEEIRDTVLQEVRNTKIAITEEDYEYLLPNYDKNIELIKCYGEKNEETADLAETYGYYVNPLNVWLIILKYSQGFSSAYMEDVAGLTDRINDIAFSTLDINPRFNERYQINEAYLNQVFRSTDLKDFFDQTAHKYALPINAEGVKLLKKKGCQITVTNYPYIESAESSRRGVNAFRRYNGSATEITWEELAALPSAEKGSAYLVTDIDKTGEVNDRWKCIESFDSVLDPEEFDSHWEKVDFSYIYDNLVSEDENMDRMWIKQDDSEAGTFYPVYSNLPYSFVGDPDIFIEDGEHWDSETEPGKVKILPTERVIITINGQDIIIYGNNEYTLEELCDLINSRLNPTTNIIFLKENIPGSIDSQIVSSEDYVRGPAHLYMTIGENPYVAGFDPTDVDTVISLYCYG